MRILALDPEFHGIYTLVPDYHVLIQKTSFLDGNENISGYDTGERGCDERAESEKGMGVKNMMAFLLLVMGTLLGVLVSTWVADEEATWLTYYIGGIVGLFVSSVTLEIRNLQRRKRELEEEKMIQKIEF